MNDMKLWRFRIHATKHFPAGYYDRPVLPAIEYLSNLWWDDHFGCHHKCGLRISWWCWQAWIMFIVKYGEKE